jgi:hypothetical protein
MKTNGIITKVFKDREFFFIDEDYFCRCSNIDFEPSVGDKVAYERARNREGKKEARNVKKVNVIMDQYFDELKKGYFVEGDFIKKEFLIEFAKELASEFTRNDNINKPSQIRKYFDYCDKINGIHKVKRNFLYVQAELPKVIPHLNNALKKGLISNDFYKFMEVNVDMALEKEEYFSKGFIPHFEALIGFSHK